MNYPLLSKQVQKHVNAFYEEHKNKQLLYHNISHTKKVVKAAVQIGNHYQLNEHDCFIVTTAAWFHDVGYYCKEVANHEEKGVKIATTFLTEMEVDEATINGVKNCILATKLPQSPVTLLEQIVCDADLFHFGTDDFRANNRLYGEVDIRNSTIERNRALREDLQLQLELLVEIFTMLQNSSTGQLQALLQNKI